MRCPCLRRAAGAQGSLERGFAPVGRCWEPPRDVPPRSCVLSPRLALLRGRPGNGLGGAGCDQGEQIRGDERGVASKTGRCRRWHQVRRSPPSQGSTTPVMNPFSKRATIAWAKSAGCPISKGSEGFLSGLLGNFVPPLFLDNARPDRVHPAWGQVGGEKHLHERAPTARSSARRRDRALPVAATALMKCLSGSLAPMHPPVAEPGQ
jgi:hypothetical protein